MILEYRRGDVSALEKLVSRWQLRIYWFILTLVKDENVAWDLSQETWMGAVKGLRKRVVIRNFPPWIYGIARNKAISYLRKRKLFNERKETLPGDIKELPEGSSDPLETAENARLVQECLNELPLAQREVLGLFYLKDLSLNELADVIKAPLGTVQSRLHYGRTKMKELLLKKGYSNE